MVTRRHYNMITDWEQYREEDGSINLKKLFGDTHLQGSLTMNDWAMVVRYFKGIELVHPIKSRQSAAIVISQARLMIQQARNSS